MSRHPERAYTFAQAITNNLPDVLLDCLGQVLVGNLNNEITKVGSRKIGFFDLNMELQELRRVTPVHPVPHPTAAPMWGTVEATALANRGRVSIMPPAKTNEETEAKPDPELNIKTSANTVTKGKD